MGSAVTSGLLVALLLGALAAEARAGEPKVYRWVGEDGRSYTSNSPPPKPADACGRYGAYVSSWRDAQQSIESWRATIARIEKRTDDFVRRSKSAYDASLARANEHLADARERSSHLEAEGRAAGVPKRCLTE